MPLSKAKASAIIMCPTAAPFNKGWDNIKQANLRVQNSKKTHGSKIGNSIWSDKDNGIKVRHALFKREGNETIKDPFIDTWPVKSEAKAALQDMANETQFKWQINIIPAFDANDSLIPPEDYERCLKGAIVAIKVSIAHQHLGRSANSDNYYADLLELKVLKESVSVIASPAKRRLAEEAEKLAKRTRLE
ncbi:uncharacterized protein PHACADRAFT_23726 [Phanerochaete carnosa HHB-10118-sp]|uniref:Uncharacterized protein n=1 Tax=Phanerochaete carnosa (strain HHB-10118-sp) TaxID=650164 RepID=K5WMG0_PHACS|nr:uncharacterized protein PHACADRAFT_23726 [Phanerochaete carnosa HHB-10118-sp]EKM60354.1 hypothetical protein PHACADRAFT_23726 [Phanerochaete carnosa HHB-10118-sp]